MVTTLLKPREVDLMLRYPSGRSKRLAKVGKIPYIKLPDGEIRFDAAVIQRLLKRVRDDKPKPSSTLGSVLGDRA